MSVFTVSFHQFSVDDARVTVVQPMMHLVSQAIKEHKTLYAYAAQVPERITMHGRGPVYAVPGTMTDERVVVRHSWRGGFARHIIRDRFVPPLRVMRELVNAMRLLAAGIPTPNVLAAVTYPAGWPFRRADIMTQYIPESADLAAVFADARNDAQRRPILAAVRALLYQLAGIGAHHPDLNMKNILVTAHENGYQAWVLDVDRIRFHVPNDPMIVRANMDRLIRSLRKWRAQSSTRPNAVPDDDLEYLMRLLTLHPV
jgi:tRNA A-37 threonylcarbamoyl transferase component Bud32